MTITDDMYYALSKLNKWYRKYNEQFIELCGVVGTGIWEVIKEFLLTWEFDKKEVICLSHNQKQVLELASKQYHAYEFNHFLYKYTRQIKFDSLYVINRKCTDFKFKWKSSVRKSVDPDYKLIIVFDAMSLNKQQLIDLGSLGLPVILIKDPMLPCIEDTYGYAKKLIILNDLHPKLARNPIIYFANKIIHEGTLQVGNYDTVSIVHKSKMNIYNLKSSDMTITLEPDLARAINKNYRERILNIKNNINVLDEKIIIRNDLYNEHLTNPDEKKIKVYLTNGVVGYLSKCNKHALSTRYISVDFRPEFYHESFEDLMLDRAYLNEINIETRQEKPDEILLSSYAYALSSEDTRFSYWDKVTVIVEDVDAQIYYRALYNAIIRAKSSLTLII